MNRTSLSSKEKMVLEFLEEYFETEGRAPSYTEVQSHFGFKSINSVQNYFKQLEAKGFIQSPGQNKKRAISLVGSNSLLSTTHSADSVRASSVANASLSLTESVRIPMLGRVAAGFPIERMSHDEFLDIPRSMVGTAEAIFALRVEGDSMIEDGIFDGDFLVVRQQNFARNGEIVVAMVEQEATVKRVYNHEPKQLLKIHRDPYRSLELRPANHTMTSFWYLPHEVEIRGVVIGLIRKFAS